MGPLLHTHIHKPHPTPDTSCTHVTLRPQVLQLYGHLTYIHTATHATIPRATCISQISSPRTAHPPRSLNRGTEHPLYGECNRDMECACLCHLCGPPLGTVLDPGTAALTCSMVSPWFKFLGPGPLACRAGTPWQAGGRRSSSLPHVVLVFGGGSHGKIIMAPAGGIFTER